MDDNRNFRSYYYEKVGFRGVEEKKSLDILLKEKPIDLHKLSHFSLRFTLPALYREPVWKILLGILPPFIELHADVWQTRQLMFDDLKHGLKVMKLIDDKTPAPDLIVKMLMLERGHICFNAEINQANDPELQDTLAIATVLTKMYSSEDTAYWLLRNFTRHLKAMENSIYSEIERVESILQKEDPEIFQHLQMLQAFKVLPISKWMARCFSEVLHEACLERIWDKVIGGSSKILAFVGAAVLMELRRPLMEIQTQQDLTKYVINISGDKADVIVNNALDLCQH